MKILFIYIAAAIGIWGFTADNCAILKHALEHKKVMDYLHPELKSRATLYVVANKYCSFNESINNIKVVTVEEKDAATKKNVLKVISIKEVKQGKIITLSYPIEGASFTIHADTDNKITEVEVIETGHRNK